MLRAVAVLAVFFAHLFRNVLGISKAGGIDLGEAGRAGVYLFFVHTSLVLLLSFERNPRSTARSFYVRRAFRIYPLSIACVLLVYLVRIPFEPLEAFTPISLPRLAVNLALMQNLTPQWKEVIAPLWSLSWEVQMYLVLPLLYLAIRRGLGTLPLLALWLAALVVGGPAWGDGPVRALRIAQYVPCFLAGAIAFVQLDPRRRRALALPSAFWPFVTVGSVVVYTIVQSFIADGIAFATKYLLCLALGFAIPLVRELPESFATRASHAIAKYSYGIYLSHFPVMWLVFQKLQLPPMVRWPLFVVLSAAVPVLAYHAIEQPLIDVGRRLAERFEKPAGPDLESRDLAATAPAP